VDGAPSPILTREPAVVTLSAVESGQRAMGPTDRFDDLFRVLYPMLFGLTYRLLGD
jgi:hypothetical protein